MSPQPVERKALRHGNVYALAPAALKRLKEAHADGVPMPELVERFGMAAETIKKWLAK